MYSSLCNTGNFSPAPDPPPGLINAACIQLQKHSFMKRRIPAIVLIPVTAILSIGLYALITSQTTGKQKPITVAQTQQAVNFSSPAEFVSAAKTTTPAVVHIRTIMNADAGGGNPLFELYGIPQNQGPSRGSGSGVTIAEDGYIVTNNHVVENASQIEVIYPDRRSFKAKLLGRDVATDLALIKVDAKNLPTVKMGNSDNTEVGEWVLAIGYPLSLNTTVTAGIISAKGRSIGILDRPTQQGSEAPAVTSPVESFIQTDAAINPGNSGGALVNTRGELIGINAAIASLTGSYAGYGFAIPSNLVTKVVNDIREFGEVRRGYLGISFPAPATEEQYFKQQGINPASVKGVLITDVQEGSAAAQAGIQPGDIVQSIDGAAINSSAEFSERIARHRPGDEVKLGILRKGSTKTVIAKLKGQASLAKANTGKTSEEISNRLGARFEPLTDAQKQRYRLPAGVVITEIKQGGLFDQLGLAPGTVIVLVNGKGVNSSKDIDDIFRASGSNRIRIDGLAPDGTRIAFTFSLGA
jgi:Trypsin-like serine proteases, typically periplasmic, contain C-terminal PDZ domain